MPELERALRELGRELDFPPEPELALAVGRRVRAEAGARRPRLVRRRPLALAFALVAVALAAALAVPQARTALLELLGIRGATVERVETLPPTDPNARLVPGERVSFEEAQAAVAFRIVALPGKDGSRCGAFYLDRSVPGGMVSVVCPEQGMPRLVLTQFLGAHTPYVEKLAGAGTRASYVDVDGAQGVWLEGAPHVVVFRNANGDVQERTRRLAGDVLLWEHGAITYRLEGDLRSREDALRIARDLR